MGNCRNPRVPFAEGIENSQLYNFVLLTLNRYKRKTVNPKNFFSGKVVITRSWRRHFLHSHLNECYDFAICFRETLTCVLKLLIVMLIASSVCFMHDVMRRG